MYSTSNPSDPIRQGDIFRWLPKVEIPLGSASLPIFGKQEQEGAREIDWFQFAKSEGEEVVTAIVRSALGIVITQDCDAERCTNVAFAEIKLLSELYSPSKDGWKTNKIVGIITKKTRENQKWYYLAEENKIGFYDKMRVDFQSVFEVNRKMLEAHKEDLRLGRLDDEVAWPHFREQVAEFFRRYPYNEWYPMNSEEFEYYEENTGGNIDPRYEWQR